MNHTRTADRPTGRLDLTLRLRLEALIGRGRRGELLDDPDVLGALFACCALLLPPGPYVAEAANLADWFDAEATAEDGWDAGSDSDSD